MPNKPIPQILILRLKFALYLLLMVLPLSCKYNSLETIKQSEMILENNIKQNQKEFVEKVQTISDKLGINPDWLMALMDHESGLDSTIKNSIGAVGLIQIMPGTAKGLGTTPEKLKSMSNIEQLDYVYLYFKPYTNRLHSLVDLCTISFFPAALGRPDDYIIQTKKLKAETIAKQNKIFDLNKDGIINYGEYKEYIKKRFKKYGL